MSYTTFEVFPEPHEERRFRVYIFDSRIESYNFFTKYPPVFSPSNFCGLFIPDFYSNKSFRDLLGTIYFFREYYSIDIISHESLHAAIHYLNKINLKQEQNHSINWEERLCLVHQYILGQILNKNKKFYNKDEKEIKLLIENNLKYYGSKSSKNTLTVDNPQLNFNFK